MWCLFFKSPNIYNYDITKNVSLIKKSYLLLNNRLMPNIELLSDIRLMQYYTH